MGRNRSTAKSEEDTVSTTTPEAPASTPAAETPAEINLDAFSAAVEATLAKRDADTGAIAEADFADVVKEYRTLDGAKPKNAARKLVDEAMVKAMDDSDLSLAKANLYISQHLTAGPVGGKEKAERTPADPTEAFTQLVAGLRIAASLAESNVPEGVTEGWEAKADELVSGSAEVTEAFRTWFTSDAEDKGDAPETPAYVQGAVKLSLGKAGKVGSAKKSSGGGTPFTGERRDVSKHIVEAFEGQPVGTFLTVAEIKAFKSGEYGEDHPSAGAVSARLFPKSGNVTVTGVQPGQNEKGVKGATKVAV